MQITSEQISLLLGSYLWPFFRIAALVMVIPIFGTKLMPRRIRLLFSLALTMVIAPLLTHMPVVDVMSIKGFYIILSQVLIGVTMGFIFQLVFQVFVVSGQIIAMQSGLGFATLIEPTTGANVPLISQFYLMLISLLFLALNGHLLVIQLLSDSFTLMPISDTGLSMGHIWEVILFSGWMFKGAVIVSLPIIISLLLINLAFGVMTRAAPQLNIFAIGFPITLTIGLIMVYLTISSVLPHMQSLLDDAFRTLHNVIRVT